MAGVTPVTLLAGIAGSGKTTLLARALADARFRDTAVIIEGEGELRFGDKRYPIRKHDVIACPPGGPDVAHQIINTGKTTMRYLALSTLVDVETCEYPDSQKISIVTGQRGESGLRKMFRAENTVGYYDRERS